MSIRAKFRVDSAEMSGDTENLRLSAVIGTEGDNKDWSKWTPSGQLLMAITNPEAQGRFKAGQIVFIDITLGADPADAPAPVQP